MSFDLKIVTVEWVVKERLFLKMTIGKLNRLGPMSDSFDLNFQKWSIQEKGCEFRWDRERPRRVCHPQ